MRISDWISDVCSSDREPPHPPLATDKLRHDLAVIARSLRHSGEGILATDGALGRIIRAVDTFGFHLAALDLRQNSDVHERTVAALLRTAGVDQDYLRLNEAARIALLRRELATPRPLTVPYAQYDEETSAELAIMNAAAKAHALFGPAAITVSIISKIGRASCRERGCQDV